jgi:autoinducer 2 (AI-2) kinase
MGETLDWLARLLHPRSSNPVARLLAEAAEVAPAAGGFVSTVGAERMDARKLELPVGTITLSHLASAGDPAGRAHLARSVVDGMGCAVRANVELLAAACDQAIEEIAVTGGMSRSALFRSVVAAALDRPVQAGAAGEATGLGAAMCAAVGAGLFADLREAVRALAGARDVVRPDAEAVRAYARLYEVWTKVREKSAETNASFTGLVLPAVLEHRTDPVRGSVAVRLRALVTAEMDEESLARLRRFADVEYAPFRKTLRLLSGKSLAAAAAGTQVLVTEVDVVDAAALADLPELRVVVACRGDAVNVDIAACTAFGIPVLHAPGRNADAVADLTLAFLLMLARKLVPATAFLHQPGIAAGDVGRMGQAFGSLQGRELDGRVVGLVGFGAVGRAVAERLAGFGARVLVSDPYAAPEAAWRHDAEPVHLATLLERSDFVSLHAAVTDETRGLIGAPELARMKRGAFLVNTARAALVDEAAPCVRAGSPAPLSTCSRSSRRARIIRCCSSRA